MDVNALSTLCYGLSGTILLLWSVESAMARPGSRSLFICGLMMAGVAFGLPRAM